LCRNNVDPSLSKTLRLSDLNLSPAPLQAALCCPSCLPY
jgi:hypothetical protein